MLKEKCENTSENWRKWLTMNVWLCSEFLCTLGNTRGEKLMLILEGLSLSVFFFRLKACRKWNVLAKFWNSCFCIRHLKNENRRKCAKFRRFQVEGWPCRGLPFCFLGKYVSEIKHFAFSFFFCLIRFEVWSNMFKNTPSYQIWPNFRYKLVNNS